MIKRDSTLRHQYIKGILGNDSGEITRLSKETILDDQGDGLKSFVSTYLALNLKEKDIFPVLNWPSVQNCGGVPIRHCL